MKRNNLKRTSSLRRTGPPSRRTPIRPVSKKRERENRQRRKVVAKLREERGPQCERCHAIVQDARDLHPHELKTRARLGSITNPANIVLICSLCHDWTHSNPAEAEADGWLLPSYAEEPT